MAGDLLIKNGTVVDGSGGPSHRGDVGIRDGKIVDAGSVKPGAKSIDAEGKIVAPGFVDVHTHYDAQIMWDPLMTCSPWHGVTTVVMGNCGFTLAPCRPEDQDYIINMFSRVEGMNRKALTEGLDWHWESFPDYVRRLDKEKLGINACTMVGHSAVRRYVLGAEANTRASTPKEMEQIKALVREALAAGAFGFTTSFHPGHYDWDMQPVPSRLASYEEVLDLGTTLRDLKGVGSIEIITKTSVLGPDDGFDQEDEDLLTKLALTCGRPINWNELAHAWERPTAWKGQIEYMERAAKQGAQVYAIARVQRMDTMRSLWSATMFESWPTWKDVITQPREKAKEMLRDPELRAAMLKEAHEKEKDLPERRKMGYLQFSGAKSDKYAKFDKKSLEEIGKATGKDPIDIFVDFSLEEGLEPEFKNIGTRNGDMDAVAQLIQSPHSLAGISDAGAHTDVLSGVYFSTFMLSEWVRERGVLTLEDAVRRLTSMPAALYGLSDRGLIQEGKAGDIVIFDLPRVAWPGLEWLHDFPGGDARVGVPSEGYEHLIVGGEEVYKGKKDTGARPGRILKSFEYTNGG